MARALEVEAARLRGGSRGAGHATLAPHGAAPDGRSGRAPAATTRVVAASPPPPRQRVKKGKLSKDAYRRQKAAVEAELTRLNLRKNHLELAMGDPAVAGNYVEMRRVTSELADVEIVLATAEDAWLDVEERAP